MPVLPNPRHEAFAQALAKGKSATEAYTQAGYKVSAKTAAEAGSRLSRNVKVEARVTELQTKAAEKAEWTAADRLKSLKGILDATVTSDPRTAIAAIAEANKMDGSYPPAQHRLAGPNGGPIEYANMTEEQIDARLAALAGGASASDT
jgi:hypothetical protein